MGRFPTRSLPDLHCCNLQIEACTCPKLILHCAMECHLILPTLLHLKKLRSHLEQDFLETLSAHLLHYGLSLFPEPGCLSSTFFQCFVFHVLRGLNSLPVLLFHPPPSEFQERIWAQVCRVLQYHPHC